MWIAKDIQSLTHQEINLWSSIAKDLPLAQNLTWARAIYALGGKAFLVFSPDEGVGGMVFSASTDGSHGMYDCVNGPYLHWDHAQSAPRQLATFIMATTKLSEDFKSLCIRPRWLLGDLKRRAPHLPVEVFDRSTTSTVVVPLNPNSELQFAAFAPRMRRTLRICEKEKVETSWSPFDSDRVDQFVAGMTHFGHKKHFTVPPKEWFNSWLVCENQRFDDPRMWLASATKVDGGETAALAQILVCTLDKRAYYLFGYENRTSAIRSAVSVSAAAHWEAMRQCATLGVRSYDLNGYMVDIDESHPYHGVCRFKDQFAGEIIHYEVPEFRIQV